MKIVCFSLQVKHNHRDDPPRISVQRQTSSYSTQANLFALAGSRVVLFGIEDELTEKSSASFVWFQNIFVETLNSRVKISGEMMRNERAISGNRLGIIFPGFVENFYNPLSDRRRRREKHFPLICLPREMKNNLVELFLHFLKTRVENRNRQSFLSLFPSLSLQRIWERNARLKE